MPRKRRRSANSAPRRCTDASCPALRGSASGAPVSPRLRKGCECGQNATLAAVLASTLDPMVTIDSYGTIQSASDSIERVFGWTPRELVGRNVRVLMPEPHHSRHDDYLATYRRTLKTNILGRTREFEGVRKDGQRFPIELSVARVDVPGQQPPLFVGAIRDISERKALERGLEQQRQHLDEMVKARTQDLEQSHEQLRLADRLAVIGTLAAGLGHDMNNVLLPARARLNALDAIDLPQKARSHLASMRESCAYLQQLTDALHMLALNPDAPEMGDGDDSGASTDLFQWWKTVGMLLSKAVPSSVRFDVDIKADTPRVAVAAHRLTQAMLNLVVNAGEAIQSMPKRRGVGKVHVWAHMAPDGRTVHLGVTDDGPGMTAEVKARAFDAFFTTKTRGLGTGLGLSLVRSVVTSAGGEIDLFTKPGKGTEIVLTLPIARNHHVSAGNGDIERRATVYALDRRASSMATHILEAAGWKVVRTDVPQPGAGSIWVTEPCPRALAAAPEFLQSPSHAVVTLGEARPPAARSKWQRLGALVAANPRDFDSLRQAIGLAIRATTVTTAINKSAPKRTNATNRRRARRGRGRAAR